MGSCRRHSPGFTIIEVLIASIVLFSAIAIGSMVLRTAMQQVNRISYRTRLASALYVVKELVREEIELTRFQGKGQWGKDVEYEWKAEPLNSAMSVVSSDFLEGTSLHGEFRLTLYSLKLTLGERGSSFKPRAFRYKELVYEKVPDSNG